MKGNGIKKKIILVLTTAMVPIAVYAANNSDDRGGQRPGPPPPEAIAACKDKDVGDSVTFKGRNDESVQAVCQSIEGMIVAVPKDHKRP